MTDLDQDRREILQVHRDWYDSNYGLDTPRMRSCFPSGNAFLMFNLSTHTYFGVDELTEVWETYTRERVMEVDAYPEIEILRLTIVGDIAWIAAEGNFRFRWLSTGERGDMLTKATEVYQRDDGEGNPVWRMWHFHASPGPAPDEPRPGTGGTLAERGAGRGPGITPLSVVTPN